MPIFRAPKIRSRKAPQQATSFEVGDLVRYKGGPEVFTVSGLTDGGRTVFLGQDQESQFEGLEPKPLEDYDILRRVGSTQPLYKVVGLVRNDRMDVATLTSEVAVEDFRTDYRAVSVSRAYKVGDKVLIREDFDKVYKVLEVRNRYIVLEGNRSFLAGVLRCKPVVVGDWVRFLNEDRPPEPTVGEYARVIEIFDKDIGYFEDAAGVRMGPEVISFCRAVFTDLSALPAEVPEVATVPAVTEPRELSSIFADMHKTKKDILTLKESLQKLEQEARRAFNTKLQECTDD